MVPLYFATISYNFNHRFQEQVIEKVFAWILGEAEKKGYLCPEVVFIDATHIKANANLKKNIKKEIPIAAKRYEKELFEEINKDREDNGKKPFDDKNNFVLEAVVTPGNVHDSVVFDDGRIPSLPYKRPQKGRYQAHQVGIFRKSRGCVAFSIRKRHLCVEKPNHRTGFCR